MPINEDMEAETFQGATVGFKIGPAFQLPEKGPDETKKDWEDRCLLALMQEIAKLLPPSYQGFYEITEEDC